MYIISLQTACSDHKPAITRCNPCKTVNSSPAVFQTSGCWQLSYMRLFEGSVQNCFPLRMLQCLHSVSLSPLRHLSARCWLTEDEDPGCGPCNKLLGRAPALRSARSSYCTACQQDGWGGCFSGRTSSSVCAHPHTDWNNSLPISISGNKSI